MKNILLVMLFVIMTNVFAQAIYYEGTYEEALKFANSQRKNVILLFGNSYCAPCKKIRKEFFGDKEIGAFLNKNFVIREVTANVSIKNNETIYENTPDGELAKKYGVIGFPHIEILNADNVSNPEIIVTLYGIDFSEIDKSKEYDKNQLPAHYKTYYPLQLNEAELNKIDGKDRYEFRLDIIKRTFEKYVRR